MSRVLDEPLGGRHAFARTTCRTAFGITSFASSDERAARRASAPRLEDWTFPRQARGPASRPHHQRGSSRGRCRNDPERLAANHRRVALDVLAADLPSRLRAAGEEAEVVGGEGHLVARDHQRLADVARLDARVPRRFLEDLRELVEELRSAPSRCVEPLCSACFARSTTASTSSAVISAPRRSFGRCGVDSHRWLPCGFS